MSSLQDILANKQGLDASDDNNSFDEFEEEPVVPQRPQKKDSEIEAEEETPKIPQRPQRKKEELPLGEESPAIPQRPKKGQNVVEPETPLETPLEPEPTHIVADAEINGTETNDHCNEQQDSMPAVPKRPQRSKTTSEETTEDFISKVDEELNELQQHVEKKSSPIPVVPKRPSFKSPSTTESKSTSGSTPLMVRASTQDLKAEVTELYSSHHVCQDSAPHTPMDAQSFKFDDVEQPRPEPVIPRRPAKIAMSRISTTELKQEVTELYGSHHICSVDSVPNTPSQSLDDSLKEEDSKERDTTAEFQEVKEKPEENRGTVEEDSIEPVKGDNGEPIEELLEAKPKVKGPPPVPKKPSSRIAAFQELLRKNQEREQQQQQQQQQTTGSSSSDRPRPTVELTAFKQNLNGMFALPGMAIPGMKPPGALSRATTEEFVESPTSSTESKEETTSDARKGRARGPRGKRLPKGAGEKVEVEDKRVIKVFDVWSTGVECDGFSLNQVEPEEADEVESGESQGVEDGVVCKEEGELETEIAEEEPKDEIEEVKVLQESEDARVVENVPEDADSNEAAEVAGSEEESIDLNQSRDPSVDVAESKDSADVTESKGSVDCSDDEPHAEVSPTAVRGEDEDDEA